MTADTSAGHALEELTLGLPDFQDLRELLERIAVISRHHVPGCSGASVTIEQDEVRYTVCASDERTQNLDEVQFLAGGGPCLDAMVTGVVHCVEETATEERWPPFIEAARGMGIASILSVPVQIAAVKLGVLNLYSEETGTLTSEGRAPAEEIAGRVGMMAKNAELYFGTRTIADQLQRAMESRAVIEQAKGVLMAENRCDEQEAFMMLARSSQTRNVKLREIAQQIVERAQTGG